MTDTKRTQAELLSIFADAQGPAQITPQDMRDFVVSVLNLQMTDDSATGILLQEDGAGGIFIYCTDASAFLTLEQDSPTNPLQIVAAAKIFIETFGADAWIGIGHSAETATVTVAAVGDTLGFFKDTKAGAVKQTVTGSRGGNAALASLLSALAAYGLIVDGTSA